MRRSGKIASRRGMLRASLTLSTVLCSGVAVPVLAQDVHGIPVAPVRSSPDKYGVDLATGALNLSIVDISAGGEDSGIVHKRHWIGRDQWRDEFDVTLALTPTKATVSVGGSTSTFTNASGAWTSDQGNGATLTQQMVGSVLTHVYTATDGTVIEFGGGYDFRDGQRASIIRRPDGEKLTFAYTFHTYMPGREPGGPPRPIFTGEPVDMSRPASVLSSSGYQVTFQYAADTASNDAQAKQWLLRTGITVQNTKRPDAGTIGSTTYSYSAFTGVRSTTITDTAGRATVYGMDAQSRITTVTLPGSTAADVSIVYNDVGRISSVSDASGLTSYTYTDSGAQRTTQVTGPNGGVSRYVFDISTQRMLSATDAVGHVTSWQYDAFGRTTRITRPEGDATQYTIDGRGNITETRGIAKPGSGVADVATTASYPCASTATCDKPAWTRDARGNQTDYAYDATTGNVMSVTAPPNAAGVRAVTSYGYGDVGGVQKLTRTSLCLTAATCAGTASERVTSIGYDANGLPTTVTNQAGDGSLVATTTIAYDAIGNQLSVDGPLTGAEDTAYFRYDSMRQRVGEISADPDGAGAMLRRATRTTFDARGRATLVEQGAVGEVSDAGWAAFSPFQQAARSYNGADQVLTETVSAGGTIYSVTQNSYLGKHLDCSATRMNPATWGAMPASACTAQAVGAGGPDRITRYTYDAADRVTQAIAGYGTPQAATEAKVYTANGQTASVTDANGNLTTYGYDGLDRLQTTTFPGGSFEQLAHDANGSVTSRRLRDGNTISYGHDALSRVISVTVPKLDAREYNRSYTYDLAGNLTRAVDANGHFADLAYDALGRQVSEASNFSTRQFGYDLAGRRTRLTWQDGFFITYEYLTTGETAAIKESGTLALASYTYDNLGRRVTITRGNGTTTSYGYNAGSELTSLTHDLGGTAHDLGITFGYNAADQITSRSASNPAYAWTAGVDVDRAYTPNALNQYTQAGGVAFGYDARGNLTASGSTAYGYTSENRLGTAPGAYLAYDPLGRLHDENGLAVLQHEGDHIITEQAAAGGILRRYVPGPNADEPVVWYEGASNADRRWLVADERGSVIAVTDGAGNAMAVNTYDEFGIPGPSNAGRFQYTGQAWLPSVGLYHYKARAYSPTMGRFMQADPIGYGDGLNIYNYVNADPVNNVDPTGQFIDPVTLPATVTVIGKPLATLTFGKVVPFVIGGFAKIFGGFLGLGGGPSPQQILRAKQQQVSSEQSNRNINSGSDIVVTAKVDNSLSNLIWKLNAFSCANDVSKAILGKVFSVDNLLGTAIGGVAGGLNEVEANQRRWAGWDRPRGGGIKFVRGAVSRGSLWGTVLGTGYNVVSESIASYRGSSSCKRL